MFIFIVQYVERDSSYNIEQLLDAPGRGVVLCFFYYDCLGWSGMPPIISVPRQFSPVHPDKYRECQNKKSIWKYRISKANEGRKICCYSYTSKSQRLQNQIKDIYVYIHYNSIYCTFEIWEDFNDLWTWKMYKYLNKNYVNFKL